MRVLKEPLFQFLLLGGLLVAAYSLLPPATETPKDRIVVEASRIENLEKGFEAVWKRSPTPEERQGLIDDYIAEEVFYREAQALGLDQDDVVIRRRMRQKMQFLLQESLDRASPDEQALRAYFEANSERYRGEDRISFRQVHVGDENAARKETMAPLLVKLNSADKSAPQSPGGLAMLPAAMQAARVTEIDARFGEGFARELSSFPQGRWVGPARSSFGVHVVYVETNDPAPEPTFEAVLREVARDYRSEKHRETEDALIERLRSKYKVVIDGGQS